MQSNPLLEQLDWFFTSPNWTLDFPNTEVLPLAKITLNHIPCKVSISTKIPKSNVFRFENYWAEHEDFLQTVGDSWSITNTEFDSAKNISVKFKRLRADLKNWSRHLSNLGLLIENCNTVIGALDAIEDARGLFNLEINLRLKVKKLLKALLHQKNIYWKNRYTVNRIRFGDECTKFFHAMATISYRKNKISQILNDSGAWIQDHDEKAGLLWNSFRNRMGISRDITMHFDLQSYIIPADNLQLLVEPFEVEEINSIVKKMPTDKAPGSDGFNGLFLKRCWQIVNEDSTTSIMISTLKVSTKRV